jgi:hypothetical protein
VTARVEALPEAERRYWTGVLAALSLRDTLFLALSLDAAGNPIAIANSDPSTRLFLSTIRPTRLAEASCETFGFVQPYPVGLFIDGVGPVVANDAYASPAIWPRFESDRYHGPRVGGREVNLFMLGVMNQIATARDTAYANELRAALERVRSAVEASAFHSELWSYEVRGGRAEPARYGTGSDVQLWSMTDLAVQFGLSRLRH